ncbi:peptide cleavage/export ABC transporter [Limosilactobacillus reuteri]|nr:peptide cleavage/export ABC transporter [Limosilactobacillus reuteri]
MYYRNYIPQVNEEDCGVAALAMILKEFGSRVSLEHLRNAANTSISGTNIYGLVEASKKYGLEPLAVKAKNNFLLKEKLPFPFIIHIVKEEKILHYYVVLKIKNKKVYIADPDPTIGTIKKEIDEVIKEWSGAAIFFSKADNFTPIDERKSNFNYLFKQLFSNKLLLIKILLFAIFTLLINIISSLSLQFVIDSLIPKSKYNLLSIIVFGLIILYFFSAIFSFLEKIALVVLGQNLSKNILLNFIKRLFDLQIGFFSSRTTGDIVSRFNDANKITEALAGSVVTLFLDTIIVTTLGSALFFQSKDLFFLAVFSFPIYFVIIISFTRLFDRLSKKVMIRNAELEALLIESIKGIEVIKSLNSETKFYAKIENSFTNLLKTLMKYNIANSIQESLKVFVQLVLNILIIWQAAYLIMNNDFKLGQLFAFNALFSYFTSSIQNLINLQPKLQNAQVANDRLNDVMLSKKEQNGITLQQRKNNLNLLSKGELVIKNVSYHYANNKEVLKKLNLRIKNDEKVALLGQSGSGKSTIAKLLVGFLQSNSGDILVDGVKINQLSTYQLRNFICYVPQQTYLFSGSIMDNLIVGCDKEKSMEEIINACKIACISNEIDEMPLKYNTKLDEGGLILSGGQSQRLAIARAILSPAKILILDESTSGLDPITEHKVIKNLMTLHKTILFITHRLAVAKSTNKVYVLKNGKIVEAGTYEELTKKKKTYLNS